MDVRTMMDGGGSGLRDGEIPVWKADMEALFALLDASRPRGASQAQIAAIVTEEAGDLLGAAVIEAIARRVVRALAS